MLEQGVEPEMTDRHVRNCQLRQKAELAELRLGAELEGLVERVRDRISKDRDQTAPAKGTSRVTEQALKDPVKWES